MPTLRDALDPLDLFQLNRFVIAQGNIYLQALQEIKNGNKRSHWMWFIFPQIAGLGSSTQAQFYAIKSLEEARAYLAHSILGPRLVECAEAVLSIKDRSALQIFGYPDNLKLKSSMTLFETAAGLDSIYSHVLEQFFQVDPQRDFSCCPVINKLCEDRFELTSGSLSWLHGR